MRDFTTIVQRSFREVGRAFRVLAGKTFGLAPLSDDCSRERPRNDNRVVSAAELVLDLGSILEVEAAQRPADFGCVRPRTLGKTYRVKATYISGVCPVYPRRTKPMFPVALACRVRRVVCFAFLGMISEKGSHILVARASR